MRHEFQKINLRVCVHKNWKHIEQKYHPTWEIVWHGDIIVTEFASTDNLIDIFTKAF